MKIAEQQKEGEAVEVKEAREEEIKKLVALFNGYNERILDAYGRAYKVTKDTPAKSYGAEGWWLITESFAEAITAAQTAVDRMPVVE